MSVQDATASLTGLRLFDHQGLLYRNVRRDPTASPAGIAGADATRIQNDLRADDPLFDDLSAHPSERVTASRWVGRTAAAEEVLLRAPFERAHRLRALGWPSRPWMGSRFSDGRHGVWYGALDIETTIRETAWHWVNDFLADAGFAHEGLVTHRRVLRVDCRAGLLDLGRPHRKRAEWLHPSALSAAQELGKRLQHEGHPGLMWPSVRWPGGICVGIFNPGVLSDPRQQAELRYRLSAGEVLVDPLSAPSSSADASAKTPADPR